MSSRDKKAQVGARVPGDLLERAKTAAADLKISFNVWVEQAFNLKLAAQPNEKLKPITDMLRQSSDREQIAAANAGGTPVAPTMNDDGYRFFDAKCKNGTYHWKCSPGNPCRFCGGEV